MTSKLEAMTLDGLALVMRADFLEYIFIYIYACVFKPISNAATYFYL